MNINLAQVNGVCLTRWRMRALKHLAGAKALVDFGALCGTTEVVPFQNLTLAADSVFRVGGLTVGQRPMLGY